MHLMWWQQLFPQIFLCSYPFRVHLQSIFVTGASWKVVQSKTKLTLLIYVRSKEDDPLGPTPLDIYLLYYLLRGLFHAFFSSDALLLKSGAQAQRKSSSFRLHSSLFVQYLTKVIIFGNFYTCMLGNSLFIIAYLHNMIQKKKKRS